MEYKGYTGKVEFDPEARILFGRVENARDVITFQSESAAEIENEFRASVDDYLEACAEEGVEPEKPYSGRLVVRLTPDLHRRAAREAMKTEESLNTWIVEAIEARLEGEVVVRD
jgi:predicted HicB family RNase H-like nuclease